MVLNFQNIKDISKFYQYFKILEGHSRFIQYFKILEEHRVAQIIKLDIAKKDNESIILVLKDRVRKPFPKTRGGPARSLRFKKTL